MTTEECERMCELCELMVAEKDRAEYLLLVQELNDLLRRKDQRLEPHGA